METDEQANEELKELVEEERIWSYNKCGIW